MRHQLQVLGSDCQVVVVCGRNKRLVDRLSNKPFPPGMRVLVQGFVSNMPELMCASDVIITKAGPGTISEALICGLPMVLNAFVPCQEEGNIPFVTENKVGKAQQCQRMVGQPSVKAEARVVVEQDIGCTWGQGPGKGPGNGPGLCLPGFGGRHPHDRVDMRLQVGVFERKPGRVAEIIKGWLSQGGQELAEMARRARAVSKPEALFDIVRDLDTLVPA